MTENALKKTPLFDRHVALGAKTADFGGWDMPIEYSGVVAEHTAVRTAVGIFDVSHMGKVAVHGDGAVDFLNSILANDLDRIPAGKAQYSMLCNESGGVIDDLIVYRWSDDGVFIIPNASNAATVIAALRAAAPSNITIDDQHLTHGIIAVQGPKSDDVMRALGFPFEHDYMSMEMARFNDAPVVVCRTGYTGEHGFELVAPNEVLVDLWNAAVAAAESVGGLPAGLGARDTLRLEAGLCLYGHDIDTTTTPVEAGLTWAIQKVRRAGGDRAGGYPGAAVVDAQLANGPARKRVGLVGLDRVPVREGAPLVLADGRAVGRVTSGTVGPTVKQPIAMAWLETALATAGTEVFAEVRGKRVPMRVTAMPFAPHRYHRG